MLLQDKLHRYMVNRHEGNDEEMAVVSINLFIKKGHNLFLRALVTRVNVVIVPTTYYGKHKAKRSTSH